MTWKRVARGLACGLLVLGAGAAACKKREQAAGQPATGGQPSAPSKAMVEEALPVDGQNVTINHSKFDIGRIQDVFDGDTATLARTENANPTIIDMTFTKPRPVNGIQLTTATMDIGLKVWVTPAGGGEPRAYSKEFRKLPNDPAVTLDFDSAARAARKIRIEVSDLNGGDGHIHIREIKLK